MKLVDSYHDAGNDPMVSEPARESAKDMAEQIAEDSCFTDDWGNVWMKSGISLNFLISHGSRFNGAGSRSCFLRELRLAVASQIRRAKRK